MAKPNEEPAENDLEEEEGEEGEEEGDSEFTAPEALAEVLTNEHFLKTFRVSVQRVCRAIETKRSGASRLERVHSARWARTLHDAMWLHFGLAVLALTAVVYLRATDKMNDGTAATLLAGVVGSLFVKPPKKE